MARKPADRAFWVGELESLVVPPVQGVVPTSGANPEPGRIA